MVQERAASAGGSGASGQQGQHSQHGPRARPPFDIALAPLLSADSPADNLLVALRAACTAHEPSSLFQNLASNAIHHISSIATAAETKDLHRRSLLLLDQLARDTLPAPTLELWTDFIEENTRVDGVEDSAELLERGWREKAEKEERTAKQLLKRIDDTIQQHTPWQSRHQVPWDGIVWSSSVSFLRMIVSLLAAICHLGYNDKILDPRPSHDTMRTRLAEATTAAKGAKDGWGRVGMSAALQDLREKFAKEGAAATGAGDAAAGASTSNGKKPRAKKVQFVPLPPRDADSLRRRDASTSVAGTCAPVKNANRRPPTNRPKRPASDNPENAPPNNSARLGDESDGTDEMGVEGDDIDEDSAMADDERAPTAKKDKGKGKMGPEDEDEEAAFGDSDKDGDELIDTSWVSAKTTAQSRSKTTSNDSRNSRYLRPPNPHSVNRRPSDSDSRAQQTDHERENSALHEEVAVLQKQLCSVAELSEGYRQKYRQYKRTTYELGCEVSSHSEDGAFSPTKQSSSGRSREPTPSRTERSRAASTNPLSSNPSILNSPTRQPSLARKVASTQARVSFASTKLLGGLGSKGDVGAGESKRPKKKQAEEKDSDANSDDGSSSVGSLAREDHSGGCVLRDEQEEVDEGAELAEEEECIASLGKVSERTPGLSDRRATSATTSKRKSSRDPAPPSSHNGHDAHSPTHPSPRSHPTSSQSDDPPQKRSSMPSPQPSPHARPAFFGTNKSSLSRTVVETLLDCFMTSDSMAGLGGMLEKPERSVRSFEDEDEDEDEESDGEWDEDSARTAIEQWVGDADFTPEDVLCAENRRRWKPDALAVAAHQLEVSLKAVRDGGAEKEVKYWRGMESFILQMFVQEADGR
ncbi:hypothetical protein Rt10032_c02g1133 [Rhodotorula toruloides]|uniref:Uncharacterized protein n=1 Tax=Rhodotorula toruloides TaxID=5286 RepID=A0A511KB01_RHOTO|nr:hypothetical protein Rt10032_c02g1133 [Rhodotorula toruloides]